MAVRNYLPEKFSGKFRRCWEILHRCSRQHEMLSLPRFGHLPARKTAAGKSAAPAGTLLDFLLRDSHSLLEFFSIKAIKASLMSGLWRSGWPATGQRNGKSRKLLGRVPGRVLGKFGVLEGVLARVLLLIPFQGKPPSQHPHQHSLQHPEFSQHSSQHPPSNFLDFPFLCSVAGHPDLKSGNLRRTRRGFHSPKGCRGTAKGSFWETQGK